MSQLTHRENQVIALLGEGNTHMQLSHLMGVTRGNVYVICANIRRKLGFNTRDKAAVMQFIRFGGMVEREKPILKLTPRQKTILGMFADGFTYAQIANQLGIGIQTATNIACKACKRACIDGSGKYKKQEIRTYLEKISSSQVTEPDIDPAFL